MPNRFHSVCGGLQSERGAALLLVVAAMVGLLGMAALAIDMGYLMWVRTKLQSSADATALAAAQEIPSEFDARTVAVEYVAHNEGDAGTLAGDAVVLGHWDRDLKTFVANGSPTDAVHVTLRRTEGNGNPVALWFARVLGIPHADVAVEAVAINNGWGRFRFLIDDEMIDTDIPVIEALAARYGIPTALMLQDHNDDWYIDIPPGEVLELPTGQVGDEALFNSGHPDFPFTSSTDPSYADFLNYNEDSSSWRYNLVPKKQLDPLLGVSRVNDGNEYPSFVSDECEVSPVYKSDISALNPVGNTPAVNALGWRRGLLAFKILAVGSDPDGPGSGLPNLVIEICEPIPIDDFVAAGGASRVQLIQ